MKTIPFHEVPETGRDFLVDGLEIELSNNRLIQVHKLKSSTGLHVTITKQLDETSKSELKFALTKEAAVALASLLLTQLDK